MSRKRWGRLLDVAFWTAVGIVALWGVGLLVFLYGWLPHYVRGETVVVPDFRGMSAAEVEVRVRQLGMQIDYAATRDEFDPDIPAGHVISQVPGPGQRVKKSRRFRFVISKGPELVRVPDLRGRSLRDANLELELLGLRVGHRSTIYSETLPYENVVITSAPEPNASIPRGATVDLLVSKGPPPIPFPMPTLVGRPFDAVQQLLRERHLFLADVRYEFDPLAAPHQVLAQTPAAGERVVAGAPVRLTVNKKAPQKARVHTTIVQYTPRGTPEEQHHVRIVLEDEAGRHIVLDAILPGGQTISMPQSVTGSGWLRIYEDDMTEPITQQKIEE